MIVHPQFGSQYVAHTHTLVDFVAGATYQKHSRGNRVYSDLFAERVLVERVIQWPQKIKKGQGSRGAF